MDMCILKRKPKGHAIKYSCQNNEKKLPKQPNNTSEATQNTPRDGPTGPMVQNELGNSKNAQEKGLWDALWGPKIRQLASKLLPHSGLLVQKHANMRKESTWTSFWLSQDTPKYVKSKHFVKDILKKSKMHRCRFQCRTSTQK